MCWQIFTYTEQISISRSCDEDKKRTFTSLTALPTRIVNGQYTSRQTASNWRTLWIGREYIIISCIVCIYIYKHTNVVSSAILIQYTMISIIINTHISSTRAHPFLTQSPFIACTRVGCTEILSGDYLIYELQTLSTVSHYDSDRVLINNDSDTSRAPSNILLPTK